MIKKISDSKFLLEYLKEKHMQWLLAVDKKARERIEDTVCGFVNNNMDDAIYLMASEGRASGLCSYPYFEEDLNKIINVLESMS